MPWRIDVIDETAIVSMNSNSANKQNLQFFDDLESCLDTLERAHPERPVVLTSDNAIFSAGFDFDFWFPMIWSGDTHGLDRAYSRAKSVNQRLFAYPRPTVAAINGHAFAGGLITALCCDYRIAVAGNHKISLNEVAIGLAMPALFTEIIRYALGTPLARQAILSGRIYSVTEALDAGIIDRQVPPSALLPGAIELAWTVDADCLPGYAFSKRALQTPYLKDMTSNAAIQDAGFGRIWACESAQTATRRRFHEVKKQKT